MQKFLMLIGPPRSGKGVIARTLEHLVGEANRVAPTMDQLSTNFGLAPLIGKSLATISDARFGGRGGAAIIERLLTLTGGDTLTIDRKNRDAWTGIPTARVAIVTNELLGFHEPTGALMRRMLGPIETVRSLDDDEQDPELGVRLDDELPGILLWALDGLARLDERGVFSEPKSSRAVRHEIEATMNPLAEFVEDRLIVERRAEVGRDELYNGYRLWCEDTGSNPYARARFGRELRSTLQSKGIRIEDFMPRVDGRQVRMTRGIALRPKRAEKLD